MNGSGSLVARALDGRVPLSVSGLDGNESREAARHTKTTPLRYWLHCCVGNCRLGVVVRMEKAHSLVGSTVTATLLVQENTVSNGTRIMFFPRVSASSGLRIKCSRTGENT